MKLPINLASQPFRRDRAMIVASAAGALFARRPRVAFDSCA
jgi:hypothetical protein